MPTRVPAPPPYFERRCGSRIGRHQPAWRVRSSSGRDDAGPAARHPIISIAPEANGGASLDLENNELTGVETVVPSPDSKNQMTLDGLLALTPQPQPAAPRKGGVLYVDAADGALKFVSSSGLVTTIAAAEPGTGGGLV